MRGDNVAALVENGPDIFLLENCELPFFSLAKAKYPPGTIRWYVCIKIESLVATKLVALHAISIGYNLVCI